MAQEPNQPLTLADCYALALKESEGIAIRKELIAEAQDRFTQALSGILPRVSFSSSDKRQDGSGDSAFTLRHVPERKFVFSQPLFSGFKEFAAMTGTQAERRWRTQEKIRAEQLLFTDVAEAFTLLLEQQEDLHVLETSHQVLLKRIEELKDRERLGRSRPSEVVSSWAQLHRVEAEMELARSSETTARQLLEFLTGYPRIDAIRDTEPFPSWVEDEERYLAKGVSRPDVRAAQEAAVVAHQQLRVAKAGFWPTVGLEGNGYLERAGVSKDISWDATFKVDVPIFDGGQTLGAVRQAGSQARQASLQLSQTQRRAIQEIRDAYTRLQSALSRSQAFAKASEATEESYSFQVEDYRLNLVNNLEVLQSLQTLQDARRELIHARYEAKRAYWSLRVATGETLP